MQEVEQGDIATDRLRDVVIVLVGTTHSGNIGAVARAMKNMGLSGLRLVAPKEFPTDEAYRRASGATDVLDSAECYGDLKAAIADCHFVAGSSARSRSFPWPLISPRKCASLMLGSQALDKSGSDVAKSALVFGRESSGLSNEELQMCNFHVNIPANPEYSSLNLAMAVQVLCYELRVGAIDESAEQGGSCFGSIEGPENSEWDAQPANAAEVEGMLEHLVRVMEQSGFYDPQNPGMLLPRIRRLFQRTRLDRMEVNIMRGILKSVQKRMEG